jgi:hypothetical protein
MNSGLFINQKKGIKAKSNSVYCNTMFRYVCRFAFLLTLCLSMLLGFPGCNRKGDWRTDNPPDPNYVCQTDEMRRQFGIRPIHPDLVFSKRGYGEIQWWDGSSSYSKTVYCDPDYRIYLAEEDRYYSGHHFPSFDIDAGESYEFLVIKFDYKTHFINLDIHTDDMSKYTFPLPDPSQWDPSSKGNENLERARLILQMWGIRRL